MRGPIRYAQSGDVSIAYQVTGDGPFDLVLVPGFISHLEFDWEEPRHAAFLERLASFSRLIRLAKRGTGLSDRHGGAADMETRMDDVRAVMDAVGSESAAIFGYFEGGPMSVLFAATYPERTRALVLFGTYAAIWQRNLTESQRAAIVEDVVAHWGNGDTIVRFAPDADAVMRSWWGARERIGGSPGAIRHLIASSLTTGVHDVLAAVRTPTLVLHRTDDPMLELAEGRYLAEHIPEARFVELPGGSTLPWVGAEPLLDEIEEFLTGTRTGPVVDRVLATILFYRPRRLDRDGTANRRLGVVPSRRATPRGGAEGARSLRGRGDRHRRRRILCRVRRPARAIRCALAIQHVVSGLGLEVRAGLHTGEIERPKGGKPRGIAVNVAARVAGIAGSGEVFVTATTRDLVAGSGLGFEDRAEHELKGLGETRRIYSAEA